jgi:hypothetical protein
VRRLRIARVVALAVAVPTFGTLLLGGGFRTSNLFLVPDLLLCALLATGAVLPARSARPVLVLGFGFASGVITTAVFSYAARGALDEGIPTLVAAGGCLVMAAWLARPENRSTTGRPI